MALPPPFSSLVSRAQSSARSAGQTAALYVVVAVLAAIGVGFLIAALYIWIASLTDPLVAALLIGAGFITIAGITLAVLSAQAEKRKRERRRAAANAAVTASTLSLANTGLRLASRIRGPLVWPAAAILVAGLFLSRSNTDD